MKIGKKHYQRVSESEHENFKKASINTLKKIGRPRLPENLKFRPISLRVDPKVLKKFKDKAKKTGTPYQTLMNEALKKAA